MNATSILIEKIKAGGEETMSAILSDLIKAHEAQRDRMISNYKRYMASADPDGVPVFSRKFEDPNKINRKLNNAFDCDIIDVKMGYMVGNPIIYELDKTSYKDQTTTLLNEAAYDNDMKFISDFNKENNIEDLDGETLKMLSICGYGSRLLYVNKDGIRQVMNINPWECIFINDGSLNQVVYAMRYYTIEEDKKIKIYVEWYDEKYISYYISQEDPQSRTKDERIKFEPYTRDGKTIIPHMFEGVPLIEFPNNEEHQGDCDKVYTLIDGYDNTISDVNSEIEQFRLAYMVFTGMVPDSKTIEEAKQTGAFGVPDPESKIEFLTKQMSDTIIENHLDRIEENIYKFAKSVNFADEAFAGNVSGIAMKFKMFSLESKCITTERKFTAALRRMYKLLADNWGSLDYKNINFIWTRNFPLNLLDESQTSMNFKGLISEKTRLSLLSFIDDPEKEMKQMDEENQGMINLEEEETEEEEEKPGESQQGEAGEQTIGEQI